MLKEILKINQRLQEINMKISHVPKQTHWNQLAVDGSRVALEGGGMICSSSLVSHLPQLFFPTQ